MSFFDAANEGLKKAQDAKIACEQVSSIFQTINKELAKFGEQAKAIPMIKRGISLNAKLLSSLNSLNNLSSEKSVPQEYFANDRLLLVIKRNGESEANWKNYEIANWRQSTKGYPCSITYDGEETVCFSAEELSDALKELFSSAGFGERLHKIFDSND